MNMTTLN